MSRRRRTRTSNGATKAEQDKTASPADPARSISLTTPPSAKSTKKSKKPSIPGRIVSLHNLPSTVVPTDILTLLSPIEIAAYKRVTHSDTGELSDIAFVLLATVQDATRVFLQLDGVNISGETARVNFVNGVRFEGQDTKKLEIGRPGPKVEQDRGV